MVELQGSGNLKSSAAPLLEDPIDFTPYEAQEQAVAAREAGPLATARRWEYILVPHVPGEQAIPAVTFSYFDPDQGGYRELRADELILAVDGEPLARGAQGDVPARQDLQRLGADIDFIKPLPAVPRGAAASAYRGGLFWILLTAPPLLNLAALSYRWQSRRRLQRLPASRRRRARRQALRRLSRAQTLLADDRKQEFYGLLAQALTVFVADRFDVPATGLTYDRIATLLAGAQLDETCVRQYMAVLEACDCARFAPSDDDASQRQELAGRARRALDSLGDRL